MLSDFIKEKELVDGAFKVAVEDFAHIGNFIDTLCKLELATDGMVIWYWHLMRGFKYCSSPRCHCGA